MKKEPKARTDFESLRVMTDDEIDYSDIPPVEDELLEKGFIELPCKKSSVA
ncbi:MAG: hypothetical protein LBL73_07530 [Synergistaceae bacterium]|jgi:hypothetical protein|nr:hypothetical protein [Synergistaceae bacterium]